MSDDREVGAGGRGSAFAGDARHRLATYGSLAPGRRNHHQLDGLAGRWFRGYVRGTLVDAGWGAGLGYPALVLDPDAAPVEVQVLSLPTCRCTGPAWTTSKDPAIGA